MPLNHQLKELYAKAINSMPSEVSKELISENEKLFSEFLYENAVKKGSKVPDVFFRDQDLNIQYLKDLIKDKNIVLSFFRGAWCPYCDLELKALAEIHDQIKAKGARLIAVSPELYQYTKDAIEKHKIDYPVYTDLGNKAADQFGLVFELPPRLRDIYKTLNIHLNVLNGEPSWTLPVPATFIISKQGIIESTYINADYTSRMEPEDILKVLDSLPS